MDISSNPYMQRDSGMMLVVKLQSKVQQ